MVDKTLIDTIKKKVKMVELASQYTDLKRMSGNIWQGPCPHPDHTDNDPSFTVWEHNNTWACYGCHLGHKDNRTNFGTDCIAFIQWIEQVTFKEAALMLAEALSIPLSDHPHQKEFDKLYRQAKAYQNNLKDKGKEYLYGRGLNDESIQAFMLGYDGDRIVFPLIDQYKNIRGFTRRSLGDKHPKYINSPNSAVFNKSAYLYGSHLLERGNPHVHITEGPLDVILAHQHGLGNVVATLSSGLTETHFEMILGMNKTPVLAYDNDENETGNKKQLRDAERFFAAGIEVMTLCLPPNMDLADISAHTGSHLVQYVKDNTKQYNLSLVGDLVNQYELELQTLRLKYLPKITTTFNRLGGNEPQKELLRNYVIKKTGLDPEWGNKINDLLKL